MAMSLMEKMIMYDMKENEMRPFIENLIKKFPEKFNFDVEFVQLFFGNKDFDNGAEKVKNYFLKKMGIVDTKTPYYYICEKMISKCDWEDIVKGLNDGFSLMFSDNQKNVCKDILEFSKDKKIEMSYNQYFVKEWGVKISDNIPGFIVNNEFDIFSLMNNAFFTNTIIIQKPEIFASKFNKIVGKKIF